MFHTHITPVIRRVMVADFILFLLGFLSYIVQVTHQRQVLVTNPNELIYNNPTLVRIRNWRYGSSILNFGAATVLAMIVMLIVSSYAIKVAEVLIWIETSIFIVWSLTSYFRRHHVIDMVFSLMCLSIFAAYFGMIFANSN